LALEKANALLGSFTLVLKRQSLRNAQGQILATLSLGARRLRPCFACRQRIHSVEEVYVAHSQQV